MRILYFDIDGVLLSYEDEAKQALLNNALQDRLKSIEFDHLVCVSGWSDMMNVDLLRKPLESQKIGIHNMLKDIFTDKEWFLQILELVYDTDRRCKHIDLSQDWFYMDDWADKFFSDCYGETRYKAELGSRIHLADPHGDGTDLLKWLDTTVTEICCEP